MKHGSTVSTPSRSAQLVLETLTGSPPPKKVRQTKSGRKVIMIIFYDHKGVVYQHAVPPQITVSAEHYISVLKCLRRHIQIKRLEIVGKSKLQHDNACPYVTAYVQQFFKKCSIQIMPTVHTVIFSLFFRVSEGNPPWSNIQNRC